MATRKRIPRVKIPASIKVSYQVITITVGPCEDMGYYEPYHHRIKIREKQKWAEESNTLLHEIFHAVYHCYNLDQNSDEEKVVSGFANGMMEVMLSNPELRNYFSKVWNAQ